MPKLMRYAKYVIRDILYCDGFVFDKLQYREISIMVKRIIALGLLFSLVLCGCGTVGEIIPDTKQETGDDTPEKEWKELYRKKIGEYYSCL